MTDPKRSPLGGEATAKPLTTPLPEGAALHAVARPRACPRTAVQTSFDADSNPSKTQQHMAPACDINNIVAKYQRTGAIDHFARHGATYGWVPAIDFREAMEIVKHGETIYADLPSSIRDRFDGVESFLTFVQDPNNGEALRDLGLVERLPATTVQATPPIASPEGSHDG